MKKCAIIVVACFFCAFSSRAQTLGQLNTLIIDYYRQGKFEEAAKLVDKYLAAAKNEYSDSTYTYSLSLDIAAMMYYKAGQDQKAESIYNQSREIVKKIYGENHPLYSDNLKRFADFYMNTGQDKKAEELYIKHTEIYKRTYGEMSDEYTIALENLSRFYKIAAQYEKAEPLYLKAIQILTVIAGKESDGVSANMNNLALLYKLLGQYKKAELLYIETLAIQEKLTGKNHSNFATQQLNLASLYFDMGKFEMAEPLYIQAKETEKRIAGKSSLYALILNNLGLFYLTISQYEKAETLLNEALTIQKTKIGELHRDYLVTLANLGLLYKSTFQYEKAEKFYQSVIEKQKKISGEDHPDYAISLSSLATLYGNMGNISKAEQYQLQSLNITRKVMGNDHPDVAITLTSLGVMYHNTGRYKKAESFYLEALDLKKMVMGENHPSYANTLTNLAYLYFDKKDFEKAQQYFEKAQQIRQENLIKTFSVLSESEKMILGEENIAAADFANSLIYINKQQADKFNKIVFDQSLLNKALILSDTKNLLERLRLSKDSSVIRLFDNWVSLKNILAKQYSLPTGYRRIDLKLVEEQTENLEKDLNRRSAGFSNQQASLKIKTENVQQKIGEDEAIIEFVKFDLYRGQWTDSVMYGAYILKKNDTRPVFVPLCEEKKLHQLFDSAGSTATSMVSNFYRGLEVKNKNAGTLGKELYKLIWQPLEPFIKGIKRINYSPAGKLYSIAFHALSVDSTTVLMDKYQLQQYTSIRQVALRDTEVASKPKSIVLFGNASFTMDSLQLGMKKNNQAENIRSSVYLPQKRSSENNTWQNLPGTAAEVNKIQQLFYQNKITVQSFTQGNASEEQLKSLTSSSPQILHISTHGFFLPQPIKEKTKKISQQDNAYSLADDPLLRSGLILAGGNYAWSGKTPIEGVEDGIATAYEISQLNLSNTELVVLSACETALGDVKGSEGVFGLQRAFKIAGVKKMIVSLWQGPDKETAELMTSFYGYWMKGKTINAAFTQAQADMRKKYSPFYWAAFVLVE